MNRGKLFCTFVLVDSRLEPQLIDIEFINYLGESGIPFAIIFTKTDKLTKNELSKSLAQYKKKLLDWWEELPPLFVTSAEKGNGKEDVLEYIGEIMANAE
jgi:GTP-binding protein